MTNSPITTDSTAAAPGAPGEQAFWSRSSKDGIGTAYHTGCRLWFTLSRGVISEIYCPTFLGRPIGSAMPLCWSHAEYLSLVRSSRDGRVFDRIEPAFDRYVVGGKRDSACEIWTFRHRTRRVPAGRTLRLILQTSATVHWTTDQWANTGKGDTAAAALGDLHFFDLPTAELPAGAHAE